jgi:hypothetical protein
LRRRRISRALISAGKLKMNAPVLIEQFLACNVGDDKIQ